MSPLLVILIIAVTVGVRGKFYTCEDNTYYKPNDKLTCKRCKRCEVGFEYNISYVRATNESGYLDCYPCVPCQKNHYKSDKKQDGCYVCVLDCEGLFRYESQPCGGNDKGHCGECKLGYDSTSKEPNAICKGKTQAPASRNTLASKTEYDKQSLGQSNIGQGNINADIGEYRNGQGSDIVREFSVINTVASVVAVLVILFIACCVYWNRRRIINMNREGYFCCKTASTVHPGSNSASTTLLSNASNNMSCSVDVELDGPLDHSSNTDTDALDKFLNLDEDQRLTMTSLQLTIDDKYISYAEQHVCGETRHELFRYLKVDKAKHDPEEELWEKQKQSFPDYIHNVFKKWISEADKDANLYVLCSCLLQAEFRDIARTLFDLQG